MISPAFFDHDHHAPFIARAQTVHTMDDSAPAEAFVVDDGWIVFTGSYDDCRQFAHSRFGADVEVQDFENACLIPGFVDCHAHPLMYGQMMTWVDCSPEKANSIPKIVELLTRAAADIPLGAPIRGYGYEQRNLIEKRHPSRYELDAVTTEREVYLMNASGHGGVVNSRTLELHGITRDSADPTGGVFFRDEVGELTGELADAACNVLTGLTGVKIGHHGPNFHLEDEPAELVSQLRHAQDSFLSAGVTAIGDAQVTKREFSTYLNAASQGILVMRVGMYFLSHLLDEVLEMGLNQGFGNARLQFSGIKFYADGTLGGWTAYFPEGYQDDPCRKGQLYHEPHDYAHMIARAHSAGLQTATHAQSPTAIGMVIDAVSAAQKEHPRSDARHRIEHCGLPNPDQIPQIADLGIRPVNQPQHYYNWGEGVTEAIGSPGERFNPLGEFAAAGVPISISSDAPVAKPLPLEAIMVAVTRLTRRGVRLGAEGLRIGAHQALAAHTINAATTLGRDSDLGSLSVGKRADFVVLGGDPLKTDPQQIAEIPVLQTWVGGRKEFG